MKIEIEDLKKVQLNVNDILMVTFDSFELSQCELDEIALMLREVFSKNKILFYPKSIKLEVKSVPKEEYLDPEDWITPIAKKYVRLLNIQNGFKE